MNSSDPSNVNNEENEPFERSETWSRLAARKQTERLRNRGESNEELISSSTDDDVPIDSAPPYVAPPQPRTFRISFCIVGWLCGFLFTFAMSFMFGFFTAVILTDVGVGNDEIVKFLVAGPTVWATYVLALFGGVLGGYVSARIGKDYPLTHALGSSIFAVAADSTTYFLLLDSPRHLFAIPLFLLFIPAGLIGGAIAKSHIPRRRRRISS